MNSSLIGQICPSGIFTAEGTPDFTVCFEHLVLLSVSNVLLLLLGVPRLWKLVGRQDHVGQGGVLYVSKLTGCLVLAVGGLVDLSVVWNEPERALHAVVSVVGYFFAALLHHYEHFHSRMSSTSLLFFWLLTAIGYLVVLRTDWLDGRFAANPADVVFHVLSLVVSVAVFWIETVRSPSYYSSIEDGLDGSPEATANVFSRLTFHWMDPLMRLGYSKDLEMEDLWALKTTDSASFNSDAFQKAWSKQLARQRPSLLLAIIVTFGPVFVSSAVFKAIQDVLAFVQPQLLNQMMAFCSSYAGSNGNDATTGFAIAFMMLLSAVLQTVMLHQYFHVCMVTGMRIRSSIVTAVYRKALRLSNTARQNSTVGEITNLMSVDASRLADLCTYLQILWSGPFQITMAIYFLYQVLGPSVFGGVAVMVLMLPINAYITARSRTLNKTQMKNKDARTKMMDELLGGIKVIKLYAWETPFLKRVLGVRESELENLQRIGYLAAAQSFTWSCTPFLVSFTTFLLFSLFSDEPLTSTKAFVALSLFNLLQFPLSVFPSVITATVEASVSFNRLYNFLMNEEVDESNVIYDPVPPFHDSSDSIVRVSVTGGSFAWKKDDADVLHDIVFACSDTQLACIVGTVGSGKSSLASAILGEMYKTSGSVTVRGSVAYVPQSAWIMNATLRDNILFGRHFDAQVYKDTIDACGLRPDLDILPGGDETEIGERGINLSGGQKQRISIARAVYANADIYILDDALSAVDAHVGKHIFDKVIGPKGILKNKARILITHGIHLLPGADTITVLDQGRISEKGTYKALLDARGAFYSLIKEHGKRAEPSELLSPEGTQSSVSVSPSKSKEGTPVVSTTITQPIKKDEANGNKSQLMSKEDSAKGSVAWSVYMAYAKSCNLPAVIAFLVIALATQGLSVFQNVYLSWWADSNDKNQSELFCANDAFASSQCFNSGNIDDNLRRSQTMKWLAGYAILGIASSISVVLQVIFVWIYCGIRAARVLHQQMLNSIVRLPQSFFDTTPLGRIMNRFSKDQYTIDEVLPRTFQGYFRTLFSVVSVLAVNTLGSPLYILFAVPLGLLYAYFQRFYLSTSRELKRLDSTSRSPIYAHFQETLGGISTIRAYKQEFRFIEINEDRLDFNQRAYYPSVSSNRWLAVRLEFIGALIVFGSALFGVLSVYLKSNISSSVIGLMLTYSLTVTQTLNWMVRQSCEIETNIVSVERVKEYVDLKPEAPYHVVATRPADGWPEDALIEFKHYSTRYREGLDLVLKDVNCVIKPREKVGIVGRTGAGKSSLTLALFRLVEAASGHILIDGVDIATLGLYELRSRLTIIPQDPMLFAETIRSNLDPFGHHTDQEIWSALESASLKRHVSSLEGGLSYMVLQGGDNFSVGQRQLICLARAVLRKTNILVLDEATAAIDVETDMTIQKTIRREFKDCTILTIAHRINTVMDSDKIMVLDQGKIVEFDSPQALLEKSSSVFYGLAKEAGQVA